jgi:hypothetical protein
MGLKEAINSYDEALYHVSFLQTLSSLKDWTDAEKILYIIKNIITQSNFHVTSHKQMAFLVLYYFYYLWEVPFTNGYTIYFIKDHLALSLWNISSINTLWFTNFRQYFDLWKNELFLNKIIDMTREDGVRYTHPEVERVYDFVQFFMVFLHENLELYSLDSEHFPLFKWLVNEIVETLYN